MTTTIPANALILVADGAKAILLRNAGSGEAVSLREESRLTPDTVGGQGPSGARPNDQSVKETNEATFSKQLAQALEAMHGRNAFKALVLVADPQTLGQLRDALHKNVAATVVHSLSKDLTNSPLKDIEAALSR